MIEICLTVIAVVLLLPGIIRAWRERPERRNRMQVQVEEFHHRFGHVVGETPSISRPELRVKLIREEAEETCAAIEAGDLPEAIDGICDLLYVAIGTAVEFGVDLQPFFDEVHRSNMAKVGGGTRGDGKTLKPPGWTPPNIVGELLKQGYKVPE